MPHFRASTEKLVAVTESKIDKQQETATLTFETSREKNLDVVFSVSVLPAVICLLAARLDELVGHIDHYERPLMQTLECSRLDTAMDEDGHIALLIGLQGGGFLPIQFGREHLTTLKNKLEEALASTDPRQRQ